MIPNSSDNLEFAYNAESAKKFRAEREWLEDKPLLVYTGTFGKVNGVSYMVSLAVELKRLSSNVRILLVGRGAEKDKVITEAKAAKVYENNLFLSSQCLRKIYPHC